MFNKFNIRLENIEPFNLCFYSSENTAVTMAPPSTLFDSYNAPPCFLVNISEIVKPKPK